MDRREFFKAAAAGSIVARATGGAEGALRSQYASLARRAIQERLIAPDGSFPAVGRSIAYRAGAFHLLAQSALRRAHSGPRLHSRGRQ